jgi:hypothetical protein
MYIVFYLSSARYNQLGQFANHSPMATLENASAISVSSHGGKTARCMEVRSAPLISMRTLPMIYLMRRHHSVLAFPP